jgi:hypothetical protein
MNDGNQTPVQEAVSLITILSILASVSCYAGAARNVPGLTPGVLWIAERVYGWLPALSALRGAQIPIVLGSLTFGLAVFACTISFAGFLAGVLAKAQLQSVERDTVRLKRNRARLQRKSRSRDNFIVS